MKKLLCSLFAVLLILSLTACKGGEQPEPEEEYIPHQTEASKEYVKEFMELLGGEIELEGLSSGYTLDEEHCYNVTPTPVAEETDMKIFKFSDSCVSLVLLDNKIYELCKSFGGHGFVNALPCDFDGDGNKDLLVASSWGSGMHRSIISVFNSVTKNSSVLYDTSQTDTPRKDLIVAKSTENVFGIEDNDDDFLCYSVLSVIIDSEEDSLVHLNYTVDGVEGYISTENTTPKFAPYSTPEITTNT